MTEILFYHLKKTSTIQTLPLLVQKSLQKKWNIIIQTIDDKNCNLIDDLLWTWRQDTFLPHACATSNNNPTQQPIWITKNTDNPNNAQVRFLIDDAEFTDYDSHQRIVRLFDGHNETSIKHARQCWLAEKELGKDLTYWQQNEQGQFVKKDG